MTQSHTLAAPGPGAALDHRLLPVPPNAAVRLGKRVNAAKWPRQLDVLRNAAKRLTWTAVEARLVRDPLTYAYRELVRPGLAVHTLRGSGSRVTLRHRSGDIEIFRKFFALGWYDWPSEVLDQLTALGHPVNVLDLGANIGLFDVHARESLPIGNVATFEPDPHNASVLEHTRDANGGAWEIVQACASNRAGVTTFQSGHHNLSRIGSDGATTMPVVDVFPYAANADLIKMNIEGAEWDILQDERLADNASAWIVEYHRINNPEGEISQLVEEMFGRAGFTTRIVMRHRENGLVWAWKQR